MSISIYDTSTPVFIRGFNNLSDLLAKAEAHGGDVNLVEARLAPDMLNLAGQIQRACDTAKFAVSRIADVPSPSFEDNETTFAELRKRIEATAAWIQTVDRAALEAGATRSISRKFRENERQFDGVSYMLTYALPNFYFHMTTAYAILRNNGVPIGKLDYLGFNG
jgi:hypothetical protein